MQAECEDSLLSFPVPDTAALFNDSLDNDLNPDLLLEASLPTESAAEPSNLTTTPVEMTNLDDSLGCEDMDETQLPLEDEGAPPSMGVDNGDSVKQTDLNDSLGCEDMDETQLPAGHGDETLHDPKINAGETDLNDSLRCEDMEDSQLPLEDVDTDGLVGAPNIATASSVEKTELNVSLGCDVTDETQLPEDITVSSVNKETVPTIADDVCNDPTPASQLPQCDVTQGSNSDDKNTSNTPKKSTSSAATEAPTTTLTKNKTSSENHQSPSSADGRPTSTLGAKVKPSFGKKKGFIAPKPKTTPPSTNTSPKGKESCGDSDEHEPKKETDSKSSGSKANNKKPSGFLAPTTVTKNLPSTSSSAETDTSSVDVQENDNTSVVEKASNKVKSKSKTSESTKTKDSQHKKTEKEAKKQEREELKKEKALKKQELEKEKERKKAEKERQKEEMHLEQERKKAEREQKKMERKLKKLEQEKNKAEKQTAGQKKKSKAKTLSNATKEQSKSDDDITDRQCEETGENRGEGEESMIPIKSTDITDESECAIPEAKKTSCDDELGQHTAPDSDRDEPSNSSSDHKPSSQPTDNPENKPNENNKTEVAVTHSTDGEVVPLEVNDKSEESDSKVCTNIIDPRSEDQKSENKQVSSDDTAKVSDSTGPKLASKKFDPPKKQKHKKEKATTKKALDSHTSNRATKTTKKKPTSNESSAAVSAQKGKKRKASSESESDGEPQMKRSKSANYSGPVWVQCENSNCKKWRQLKDCLDPALVPEKWLCSMNSDENYNSCSAPEEHWSDLGESQEFVESPFVPGSVVWAKMDGYPW